MLDRSHPEDGVWRGHWREGRGGDITLGYRILAREKPPQCRVLGNVDPRVRFEGLPNLKVRARALLELDF